MTDNEIIKGLMCHRIVDCRNCTFNGHGCSTRMYTEVLGMFDRLKAENENHQAAFRESIADMLSEYSNILVNKMLIAKEHTLNNPNKEDSLEYIRGKAEAFESAVKTIDRTFEEVVDKL